MNGALHSPCWARATVKIVGPLKKKNIYIYINPNGHGPIIIPKINSNFKTENNSYEKNYYKLGLKAKKNSKR